MSVKAPIFNSPPEPRDYLWCAALCGDWRVSQAAAFCCPAELLQLLVCQAERWRSPARLLSLSLSLSLSLPLSVFVLFPRLSAGLNWNLRIFLNKFLTVIQE